MFIIRCFRIKIEPYIPKTFIRYWSRGCLKSYFFNKISPMFFKFPPDFHYQYFKRGGLSTPSFPLGKPLGSWTLQRSGESQITLQNQNHRMREFVSFRFNCVNSFSSEIFCLVEINLLGVCQHSKKRAVIYWRTLASAHVITFQLTR